MAADVRTRILVSASALALSACAADPATHRPAPVSYPASAATRASAPASAPLPSTAGRASQPQMRSAPTVTNQTSTSASPAVLEAASLKPELSPRPGGGLRQPTDDPAKRRIEVRAGDKLSDIAHRYSVNLQALARTNHLEAPYALNPGAAIYLPPPNVHVVEPGETLYSISHRFNVDTRSLALLNGLERPWLVWPGDEILLPPLAADQGETQKAVAAAALPPPKSAAKSAAKPAAKLAAKPAPAPVQSVQAAKPPKPQKPAVKQAALTPKAPPALPAILPEALLPEALLPEDEAPVEVALAAASKPMPGPAGAKRLASNEHAEGHLFIWPISGPILKAYGVGPDGQSNDGVNIGASAGADVHAAAAGQVVYAGNDLAGFGNLILIRHADGWVSAYAHAERLLVRQGDHVEQGQAIATAGATGSASTPQVHFELRRGKQPVDPAEYLPALAG